MRRAKLPPNVPPLRGSRINGLITAGSTPTAKLCRRFAADCSPGRLLFASSRPSVQIIYMVVQCAKNRHHEERSSMTVGCFIGPVSSSFIDEAQESAASFVSCIDSVLKRNGLRGYQEPGTTPDVYNEGLFGRSALDHHTGRCLAELAELGRSNRHSPHLGLIADNPYRVTFVPDDFEEPLPSGYCDRIWNENVEIWVGSAPRLLAELVALAPVLGIPLVERKLTDQVTQQINDSGAPLCDGDDCSLAEDELTAWLLLYEGARLAVEHGVPLSLAG